MKLTSLRAGLAGAALVACGLLAAPAAAVAAPPPGSPGVDHASVPAAESSTAAQYWTADRMRSAVPADVLVADRVASTPASEVAKGDPVTYGKPVPAPEVDLNAASEAPVSHIGKVFFTLSGRNYVCSANSVSATNGSVVSTAGHCVHGGKGKFASRWIFVPAYENGAAPLRPVGRHVVLGADPVDQGWRHHVRHGVREGRSAERAHPRAGRRGIGGGVQPGARTRRTRRSATRRPRRSTGRR